MAILTGRIPTIHVLMLELVPMVWETFIALPSATLWLELLRALIRTTHSRRGSLESGNPQKEPAIDEVRWAITSSATGVALGRLSMEPINAKAISIAQIVSHTDSLGAYIGRIQIAIFLTTAIEVDDAVTPEAFLRLCVVGEVPEVHLRATDHLAMVVHQSLIRPFAHLGRHLLASKTLRI